MMRTFLKLAWAAAIVLTFSSRASGQQVGVYNVSELNAAVNSNIAGLEIIVHRGTYYLTSNLWMDTPNVTLRGSTGDWNDVMLHCGGMNVDNVREGIQLVASGIMVEDLTVGECFHHAIHFQNGAHNATVRNVRTLNAGEHHMKGVRYTSGGVIESCLMEQTYARTNDWGGGGQRQRPRRRTDAQRRRRQRGPGVLVRRHPHL